MALLSLSNYVEPRNKILIHSHHNKMCRTTEFSGLEFRTQQLSCLKIKSFCVRLTGLMMVNDGSHGHEAFGDDLSLTLVYLPRFNENDLVIDGSRIKPGSVAYLTLHRAVSVERKGGEVVFESRERVQVGEGVRFEVYSRGERVLEGVFRKEEEWKLKCKCGLEGEVGDNVAVAEVCVSVEGQAALRKRVVLTRRKGRRCSKRVNQLEVIAEEGEEVGVDAWSGVACCCCGCETDVGGLAGGESDYVDGPDLRGVSWAVDVGVWVMCLGVGYVVSKASAKSLRRWRML